MGHSQNTVKRQKAPDYAGAASAGRIGASATRPERDVGAVTTEDGVRLRYEEAGSGFPMIFVHEFAGDARSWEPQLRYFSRRYRCIAYSARGYPPSDVPGDPDAYSQDRARDDVAAVLRGLAIERAHVVGLSMGAFATLHFGMAYPEMAASLVAAGVGYGALPEARAIFAAEVEALAARIRAGGMAVVAADYARGPTRLAFAAKDPRGFAEFAGQLAEHSTEGSAFTMFGVQRRRPGLYDLADRLRAMSVPTLIVCGDEDDPAIEPSIYLKRTLPAAGLVMLPRTGHTINLEEPDAFNRAVLEFVTQVEAGRWAPRDPAGLAGIITARRD
jgi:pimeloyl-ACP methyl ester carboxylesterase